MRKNIYLLFIVGYLFLFSVHTPVGAQGTFGPTCEAGITCSPTPLTSTPTQVIPTAISTAVPTVTPRPTLPVTGPMEVTYTIFGIGGLLLFSGLIGVISFRGVKVDW